MHADALIRSINEKQIFNDMGWNSATERKILLKQAVRMKKQWSRSNRMNVNKKKGNKKESFIDYKNKVNKKLRTIHRWAKPERINLKKWEAPEDRNAISHFAVFFN